MQHGNKGWNAFLNYVKQNITSIPDRPQPLPKGRPSATHFRKIDEPIHSLDQTFKKFP